MASNDILASFYGMNGQRCMGVSVLVCVGDCSHILEKIKTKVQNILKDADFAPLISKMR